MEDWRTQESRYQVLHSVVTGAFLEDQLSRVEETSFQPPEHPGQEDEEPDLIVFSSDEEEPDLMEFSSSEE